MDIFQYVDLFVGTCTRGDPKHVLIDKQMTVVANGRDGEQQVENEGKALNCK